jgi:hypothetical protein
MNKLWFILIYLWDEYNLEQLKFWLTLGLCFSTDNILNRIKEEIHQIHSF